MSRVPLIALAGLLLAATLPPASARARHHHHPTARASNAARPRAATVSHAAIPQNANIETLNDLSLRRARAGENTNRPLAPPLAQ